MLRRARCAARGLDHDIVVRAVAMLLDPGAYMLHMSLGGVTMLERPVVIG